MKKLNVAIIGQGRSGRDIHGAFFKSEYNEKFNVIAVVDAIEERRIRAKEEWGCDIYADYRELFGRTDIDLVINSSFSHRQIFSAPVPVNSFACHLCVIGFAVIPRYPGRKFVFNASCNVVCFFASFVIIVGSNFNPQV